MTLWGSVFGVVAGLAILFQTCRVVYDWGYWSGRYDQMCKQHRRELRRRGPSLKVIK